MKKLYSLCLALLALGSSAWAATPGVTFLFSNGEKASFAFSAVPKITMTSTGVTVSASGQEDAGYQFSAVQRYYFEDDIQTAIGRVDADGPASHPLFSYAGGVVSVSGLKAGGHIRVVSMSGAVAASAVADQQGNASVDLSAASSGVFSLLRAAASMETSAITARSASSGPVRSTPAAASARTTSSSAVATTSGATTTIATVSPSAPSQNNRRALLPASKSDAYRFSLAPLGALE